MLTNVSQNRGGEDLCNEILYNIKYFQQHSTTWKRDNWNIENCIVSILLQNWK